MGFLLNVSNMFHATTTGATTAYTVHITRGFLCVPVGLGIEPNIVPFWYQPQCVHSIKNCQVLTLVWSFLFRWGYCRRCVLADREVPVPLLGKFPFDI